MKKIILTMLAMVMAVAVSVAPKLAYADSQCGDGQVQTSVLGENGCVDVGTEGQGIFYILNLVLTIMTYGVGVLATAGFVIAGYTYLTAKDDASKIQKAKDRILQIVIGLVIYAVLWSVLQFILPGGLFGDGSG